MGPNEMLGQIGGILEDEKKRSSPSHSAKNKRIVRLALDIAPHGHVSSLHAIYNLRDAEITGNAAK